MIWKPRSTKPEIRNKLKTEKITKFKQHVLNFGIAFEIFGLIVSDFDIRISDLFFWSKRRKELL